MIRCHAADWPDTRAFLALCCALEPQQHSAAR
jgi:hypothetical protein